MDDNGYLQESSQMRYFKLLTALHCAQQVPVLGTTTGTHHIIPQLEGCDPCELEVAYIPLGI